MPVVGSAAAPPQLLPPSSPGMSIVFRVAGRREQPLVARVHQNLAQARLLGIVDVRVDVGHGELLARERRRLGRERLRRPGLLARHVALRHRPLLDRPERLAGHAIEHVEEAGLGRLRDDVDALAVVLHGEQLRAGDEVVVPEVVMDGLEVPQALAGARVEREQAVAEQVRADAVGAVEIVGRRAGREVGDAALLVDGDLAPGVGAADVLPGVLRPGVVAELARMRNGVERPDQLAGEDVVRAEIAGRRSVAFAGRRAQDDQVLEDAPGRAGLNAAPARRGRCPRADRRGRRCRRC